MSLEDAAGLVAARAPDYFRGVMAAPKEKRPVLLALLALDIELFAAANASREDMVNAIKIAWWAEAIARLPERVEDHPVLEAIVESGVLLADAVALVGLYQKGTNSLPFLVEQFAGHLGADNAALQIALREIGNQSYRPRKWPKNARPIFMMLKKQSAWRNLKLICFGRG